MATNYEHKPGNGSAFVNKERTEDWHAPFRGKVMLPDGSLHYLDVWNKKTTAGETWVAMKIGKQIAGGQVKPVSQHSQAKGNGFQQQGGDHDIPF